MGQRCHKPARAQSRGKDNTMGNHMLQRRIFLSGLAGAGLVVATFHARAQRPAQPIARPPGQRLNRPLLPGRFQLGGVASGALPGVYVVLEVDAKAETMQLRDEGGTTGLVHVDDDLFDLGSLKPGDEVEVDFLVPDPGSTRLEAGAIWKVQR
jgi:hypothetical protein